ncbi:MAG: TIGR00341 family protein, partial [Pseudomonadota bacterium]
QQRKEAAAQKAMETGKDSGIGMAKNHVAAWFEFFNLRDILRGSVTREELQMDMEAGGKLSFDFLLLVFLSAIVAGIGLIQSDVAIIIGAMVIAPLLGPNLAMAFAAGLGNKKLFLSSLMTNIIGLSFALFISVLASFFMDMTALKESTELMNRTNISFATIALALASGAAAVLSLTTGVSSALVGVMVAVALLPPAVTLGLFTGQGQWDLAFGAGLLLATNIICINISALVIFRLKGVRPRTWYEEKTARKNARFNLILWIGILILLSALIWFKNEYMPIVG